ncbi:MAG: hypothetical protein ACJAXN_000952 [Psychromonas sp.]|jgi:hypothetical protein
MLKEAILFFKRMGGMFIGHVYCLIERGDFIL